MEIILDVGYYNINTLLSEITLKMSREEASLTRDQNNPSLFLLRKFAGETFPTYSYNINENYEVSIFGSSTSSSLGDKFWGFYSPIKEMKSSLVHSILGFQMNEQIRNIRDIVDSNKKN